MEVRCGGGNIRKGTILPIGSSRDVDREYMIDKGMSSTPRSSSSGLVFQSSIHTQSKSKIY